jgi:hypothetical protein
LRVIILPGCRLDGRQDVGRHGLDRLEPVDRRQDPLGAVVVDDLLEGRQLLGHPGADRRFGVVRPMSQRRAVDVADAGDARRVGQEVVDVAVRGADQPIGHPQDEVFDRDVDEHGEVNPLVPIGQRTVEGLGLAAGPGEAVEDCAAARIRFVEAVEEDLDDHVVGDQLAGAHDRADLAGDGRIAGRDPAEQVTRTEDRDAEMLPDDRGLGAFSRAWCAEEDDDRHGRPDLAAEAGSDRRAGSLSGGQRMKPS